MWAGLKLSLIQESGVVEITFFYILRFGRIPVQTSFRICRQANGPWITIVTTTFQLSSFDGFSKYDDNDHLDGLAIS